ncbi:MAG TPA: hypothetical protein DCR93_23830, partial [Cytophagales bacterium]|nr:hypothetical protein [Cytophagales bacterium]
QALEVTLSYIPSQAVSVNYSAVGGDATNGDDYTLADGTVTLEPGNQKATFDLTLINDVEVEDDETILIALSNPSVGVLGANDTLTFTINDEDNARNIQFTNTTGTGSESTASVSIPIEINLVDTANDTKVYYSVTTGTAIGSGVDYT